MEHVILNAETGEVTVVPFTPEEEAATLAAAVVPPKPTLEELQVQLASLSAQIASFKAP